MTSRKPVRRSGDDAAADAGADGEGAAVSGRDEDPIARLVGRDREAAEDRPEYDPGPGSTDLLAPRTVAQLLDWGIVIPPVFALDLFLAGLLPFPVRLLVEFGIYLAYGTILEGYWGGQTLGKAIMDLVVVDEDGDACTPRQALIRNLPALVAAAWVPYVLALLSIVSTDLNQRFFDRFAGTAVVRA